MPLSNVQREILTTLATHRDPDSDVAGSTPLHAQGPRFSGDIDIFHGRAERAEAAALADAATLVEQGFAVEWLRRGPSMHAAAVRRGGEATKLEWVADSDFRFFPIVADDLFGWRLHVVDIATRRSPLADGANRATLSTCFMSTTPICRLAPSSGRRWPRTPVFLPKA